MMTSVTETGTAHELRALLDQSPAMLASWDAELRNVVANKAYVDWFDQDPATMTGRHVREVIGEELYAHNLPHIRRALAGEEVVFEVSFTDAHGRDRASEVTYRPRRAPDGPDGSPGEVLGLFTQVVDVTGLVRAREQMDEAQRLADLGSWEARPAEDGAEMTWSAQMYALTGHDPATYRRCCTPSPSTCTPRTGSGPWRGARRPRRPVGTTSSATGSCARTAPCATCSAGCAPSSRTTAASHGCSAPSRT